jgi:penicillin amidase
MFAVQNETYSFLAANTLPLMLTNLAVNDEYTKGLGAWDYYLRPEDKNASLFQIWWEMLYTASWGDVLKRSHGLLRPSVERTMQLLHTDSTRFKQVLATSYKAALDSLGRAGTGSNSDHDGEWYRVKNTTLTHLAKIPAFSYKELKVGGWGNTINAVKTTHGPSWRMVVEMGRDSIRGYGVYPGGQSGNPGSKYYGTFVNQWVEGKYNPLVFLPDQAQQTSNTIKYIWTIQPK